MIARQIQRAVEERLKQFPAVAILGARQTGKTTLAHMIAAGKRDTIYLDLESRSDRARLAEPALYLSRYSGHLIVLDEVQHTPELFAELRGLIDSERFGGVESATRFLILGSASGDLLRQSGESLAGRIAYVELTPLTLTEIEGTVDTDEAWLRGGMPESLLASDIGRSVAWRENFIRTFLERDIPQLGPRLPAETLQRLWTMLAHANGSLLNAAEFARALAVDGKTVARYIDVLSDVFMVRRLPPWHGNTRKRLVKSPRVYLRDSGILHTLLGIDTFHDLLGHPIAGTSWEGFAIEQLISSMPDRATASFYRSAGGAEVDLLISVPGDGLWAIEVKRSRQPRVERSLTEAREELEPRRTYVVYPGVETFPLRADVEAIPLTALCRKLIRWR